MWQPVANLKTLPTNWYTHGVTVHIANFGAKKHRSPFFSCWFQDHSTWKHSRAALVPLYISIKMEALYYVIFMPTPIIPKFKSHISESELLRIHQGSILTLEVCGWTRDRLSLMKAANQLKSKLLFGLSRVSQPWHYGHLGPFSSLLWEVFLCSIECLAAILTSTS